MCRPENLGGTIFEEKNSDESSLQPIPIMLVRYQAAIFALPWRHYTTLYSFW